MTRRFVMAAVLGMLAVGGRAEAAFFQVSGDFGGPFPGFSASVFNGGSFDGTFSTSSLPLAPGATATLDSFAVNLRDPSGGIVFTISSATPGYLGLLTARTPQFPDRDQLRFIAIGENVELQLSFPTPFTGVGTIIPTEPSGFISILGYKGTTVVITSGRSIASTSAVPEPSGLALCGLASLAGLGAWVRRRRAG